MKEKFGEKTLESAKEQFDRLYNYGNHELKYSKGYPEYEYVYECCKNDLEEMGYERVEEKELGFTLVIIRKKNVSEKQI